MKEIKKLGYKIVIVLFLLGVKRRKREPTIEDLFSDMAYVKRLSESLNISFPDDYNAYLGLAEHLKEEKHLTISNIHSLKMCATGSPTKVLIQHIIAKNSKITVGDFVRVSKDLQRADVADLLAVYPQDKLLKDLRLTELNELATKLDSCTPTVNNWRDFAGAFKLSYPQIKQIEERTSQHQNPAKKLLEHLYRENKDFRLSELKKAVKTIGRNDVAVLLDEMEFYEDDGDKMVRQQSAVQDDEDEDEQANQPVQQEDEEEEQQAIYAIVNQNQPQNPAVRQDEDEDRDYYFCPIF